LWRIIYNLKASDININCVSYQLWYNLVHFIGDITFHRPCTLLCSKNTKITSYNFIYLFLLIFSFLIFKGKDNLQMLILHLFTVHRDFFHVGMDNVLHLTNFVILRLTVQITAMKPCVVSENFKNPGC